MLIIAVSHGYNVDKPYTKTFHLNDKDVSVVTLRNVLEFLERKHNVETHQLDEVLVLDNSNDVMYHYNKQDLDDDYEEVDEDDPEFEIIEKVA